jgi:hypothetical protein
MAESTKPLNFNQLRRLKPGGLREVEPPAAPPEVSEPPLDHPRPPEQPKQAQPTSGGLRPPKPKSEHAPARDFNRRANSLDRDAMPAGLFPGSSKKLYDALYLRTRGAIVPVISIRATRRELGQWSGIKNIKTIAAHLSHLTTVGLIVHHWERGSTEGSLYEVRLPEEANLLGPGWSKTTLDGLRPPDTTSDRNSVLPLDQKLVSGGSSQGTENIGTSGERKTSFKTNTESDDDDAALAEMNAALKSAAEEITGRKLTATEASRWRELADVLIAELRIAAARTTVSSVPSFLAEHLRRRLWKIDKKQAQAEGRELPDQAAAQTQAEDAKACPDCGGSGWWYPEGAERGVKKCRHEKLREKGGEAS